MGSHSGSGSVWDVASPDVDQPHGNAYLEVRDLRTGVGVRLAKEHVAPADSTVGGEHIRGGCAVLALADDTDDIDAGAQTDATYIGGGLVYDQTRNILLCWSNDGTQTAAADTYDLQWSALSICKGDDFTWDGGHLFDASVAFSDVQQFTGDLSISGDMSVAAQVAFDGTVDFNSSVEFSSDVTVYIDGDLSVGGVASFGDDISVDGTSALQNMVLTGDSTFTFDAIAGETGPTFNILGDWSSRSQDTTYTARTDGFVSCYQTNKAAGGFEIQTPAGTARMITHNGHAGDRPSGTSLIKKGNTWCTVSDATAVAHTVFWLPIGDNT